MTLLQKLKKYNIDLSCAGFGPAVKQEGYFCTPLGSRIIGRAGVDGIHFVTVRGFAGLVFAVNPTNTPGRCVHLAAGSLEDFLRLLMACGDTAAIEQCWMWDRSQFEDFLAEYPPTPEAQAAFADLREKLSLEPMPDPYGYMQHLLESFDYGRLAFPDEYYEALEDTREQRPTEWKVTYDGGFFPVQGRGGREIRLDRVFQWNGEEWHAPSLYLCKKGAVLDLLVKIDAEKFRKFRENPIFSEDHDITLEEHLMLEPYDPANLEFQPVLILNGRELTPAGSQGNAWFPTEPGYRENLTARWVLEHYGITPDSPWVIRRCNFPWRGAPVDPTSARLRLIRDPADLPVPPFTVSGPGDTVTLKNPRTGAEHTLTVTGYAPGQMADLHNGDMELPGHYIMMKYTLTPDIPRADHHIRDLSPGDSPRPRTGGGSGAFAVIGMIGGADGPLAVTIASRDTTAAHTAISSLHFQPPAAPIRWLFTFRETPVPDLETQLL